jgi:hypothetical protein
VNNEEAADLLAALPTVDRTPVVSDDQREALRMAITALRTPPATGAAAMREACLEAVRKCNVIGERGTEGNWFGGVLAALEQAEADMRALPAPEVPDKYAAFGKAVWLALSDRIGHGEMDETDADNAELAVKAGLAEHVHYDPEKHGDVQDAAPGDKIVWWGGL